MKLPPKHQRWRRLLYRIVKIFFPDPFADCTALTPIERAAALEIRLGRERAKVEGNEHEEALGVYRAGQLIREHNRKLNFDRNAGMRARTPVDKPRLPREPKK